MLHQLLKTKMALLIIILILHFFRYMKTKQEKLKKKQNLEDPPELSTDPYTHLSAVYKSEANGAGPRVVIQDQVSSSTKFDMKCQLVYFEKRSYSTV